MGDAIAESNVVYVGNLSFGTPLESVIDFIQRKVEFGECHARCTLSDQCTLSSIAARL